MPKRVHLIIKSHHGVLRMLSKARGKKFNIILNNTPDIVKAIKVLFRYILDGSLKMKPHHKQKLKPHRKLIRKIAHGEVKESKSVVQKGGSLIKTILSTIVPLIPALL
ncbi:MAG: hypothetical protein GY816_17695 [Cytophagales bacterium]|nr:hypothetical protein [Cytophagales bacterium]